MIDVGPCTQQSIGLHAFIVLINMVQAVALAYLAQRAVRKDNAESKANSQSGN